MVLKQIRNTILIAALVVLSGGIGYRLGVNEIKVKWNKYKPEVRVVNKEPPPNREVDFSLFWDVWDRLEKNYVDKSKIAAEKMVYGAISGMTASLDDPYTVFLAPERNKESKDDLAGRFEGIGAQLGMRDSKIVVIAPLKDMPAEKAGLKAGDWIVEVDNQETQGWTLPEAVQKIRGTKGTAVALNILHEGTSEPVDIEIIRDTIIISSVESWIKPEEEIEQIKSAAERQEATKSGQKSIREIRGVKIAYLRLNRFGDGTNEEWNEQAREIKEQLAQDRGIKGLVLDLRNNPGGYLSGAVYIASEFLKEGVVAIQEQSGRRREEFRVNHLGNLLEVPLAVLVNEGSASASEIVAGALRDHRRAVLVGKKTFGKGSVQEAQDLPDGSGLHITTAKWLLPNGEWINGTGIMPENEVDLDASDPTHDTQLERAVEILGK